MRRKMTDHDLSGISLSYHFPTNHIFMFGYEWTQTIDPSLLNALPTELKDNNSGPIENRTLPSVVQGPIASLVHVSPNNVIEN